MAQLDINPTRLLIKQCQTPSIDDARAVTYTVTEAFWDAYQAKHGCTSRFPLRMLLQQDIMFAMPDADIVVQARQAGAAIAAYDAVTAGYLIGCLYTALLPKDYRAALGVYYTPPMLTRRLLDIAELCGVEWSTAKVLDPACGGGAFLAPVALRIQQSLVNVKASAVIDHLGQSLRGFEIDPFSAWLSQVFLDTAMLNVCRSAEMEVPVLVEIKDALATLPETADYDAVVGNPPYGRIKLPDKQREQFQRSLYGHANLYGLFTDQALHHTRRDGVIAFVTPASFLAGQYFKNLRALLVREAPPQRIDFVSERTGVFDDVLQETVLAVYRKGASPEVGATSVLQVNSISQLEIESPGLFFPPENGSDPWIIPRSVDQLDLVRQMSAMPHRLKDYRYKVSTGPLVWNRHKEQLRDGPGENCFPLIWAEAVTSDGRFVFRAEKRNHQPYFCTYPGKDEWLKIYKPCVLLQRTTAKEQQRRLIAAALPAAFIQAHEAVVVENHLNMIIPTADAPLISPKTVACLLNSHIVDQAFRCINGSVAVSAYELETLPLPPPQVLFHLDRLIQEGVAEDIIEQHIEESYHNAQVVAAA